MKCHNYKPFKNYQKITKMFKNVKMLKMLMLNSHYYANIADVSLKSSSFNLTFPRFAVRPTLSGTDMLNEWWWRFEHGVGGASKWHRRYIVHLFRPTEAVYAWNNWLHTIHPHAFIINFRYNTGVHKPPWTTPQPSHQLATGLLLLKQGHEDRLDTTWHSHHQYHQFLDHRWQQGM